MCVSCLLRPPCLFPRALSRRRRSEAFVNRRLLVSARLCVCGFACADVEAVRNLASGCIIFWDGCPFPPEGLIEERWLSPSHPIPLPPAPPFPAQTLGVEPSVAQLGSLTAAKAAAQNLLDLWPVHGPAPTALHHTTHRWLDHLLEITLTGVQQVFLVGGGQVFHPPLESSCLPQVFHVHVCPANKFLGCVAC